MTINKAVVIVLIGAMVALLLMIGLSIAAIVGSMFYYAAPVIIGIHIILNASIFRGLSPGFSLIISFLLGSLLISSPVYLLNIYFDDFLLGSYFYIWSAVFLYPLYLFKNKKILILTNFYKNRELLACILFFGIASYACYFLAFSEYPFRYIFQEIHAYKAGHELSRFGEFNIYTSDSYIAIFPILYGWIHKISNVNMFSFHWLLPITTYLFSTGCLYSIIKKNDYSEKSNLILCLILSMSPYFISHTNASLVAMVCSALIFEIHLNKSELRLNYKECLILSVITIIIYQLRIPYYAYVYIFILSIIVSKEMHGNARKYFFAYLLILLLMPIHRGVILFIPASYLIIRTLDLTNKVKEKKGKTLFLIITTTGTALCILGLYTEYFAPNISFQDFLISISEKILLKKFTINFDSALVSNNVISLLRTIPVFALIAWIYLAVIKQSVIDLRNFVLLALLIASTCFAFPYVYRIFPVYVAAFVIIFASELEKEKSSESSLKLISVAGLLFTILNIVFFVYVENFFNTNYFYEYRIIITLLLLSAVVQLKKKKFVFAISTIIFCGSLAANVLSMKRMFEVPVSRGSTMSHYEKEDLVTSDFLKRLDDNVIVASDPITMSNIKMITGVNSVITYENIDRLNNDQEYMLRELISKFLNDENLEKEFMDCSISRYLQIEARWANRKISHAKKSDIESAFLCKNKVYFIVNNRTKAWLDKKPNNPIVNIKNFKAMKMKYSNYIKVFEQNGTEIYKLK